MSCYFVQKEEYELNVHMGCLSLFPFGVVIVWEWEWSATDDFCASPGSDDEMTRAQWIPLAYYHLGHS